MRSKLIVSTHIRRMLATTAAALAIQTIALSAFGLNLYEMSPSPTSINGIDLPRNRYDLYRGMSDEQMDYRQAVQAMLGDKTKNVESPVFTVVRQKLMGLKSSPLEKLRGVIPEMEFYGLNEAIQRYNKKKINDESKAFKAADEMMSSLIWPDIARDTVIDYGSAYRSDWPRSFVYSTAYVEIAKIYGPNVLIFNENSNRRSLDLNYWNKKNNGYWVHTNLSFPDKGEFLSPFYIPGESIIGFQHKRTGYRPSDWNIYKPLSADMTIAFMKTRDSNIDVVMIFDPTGLENIVQTRDGFCAGVSQFNPKAPVPLMNKEDCQLRPRLLGIARLCEENEAAFQENCSVSDSLFSRYESADRNRFSSYIEGLEALRVRGKRVVVLPPSH